MEALIPELVDALFSYNFKVYYTFSVNSKCIKLLLSMEIK